MEAFLSKALLIIVKRKKKAWKGEKKEKGAGKFRQGHTLSQVGRSLLAARDRGEKKGRFHGERRKKKRC